MEKDASPQQLELGKLGIYVQDKEAELCVKILAKCGHGGTSVEFQA